MKNTVFNSHQTVRIILYPGRNFNMYDDNIIYVHMIAVDKKLGSERCIGFYGKGKMEQQRFFYNPHRSYKILTQDESGICLECDKDTFQNPGRYRLFLGVLVRGGNYHYSGPVEIDVI